MPLFSAVSAWAKKGHELSASSASSCDLSFITYKQNHVCVCVCACVCACVCIHIYRSLIMREMHVSSSSYGVAC
jgi:hypothetical protein